MGINLGKYETESVKVPIPIVLHEKAIVIKRLSHSSLWKNFLLSTASSFALSNSEVSSIMATSFKINVDSLPKR